jgi:hypoxanthine phosphoribosyltransferase
MTDPEKLKIGGDTLSLFIDSEEIRNHVVRLAQELERDFKEENPLFLCVLNGAFVFASDLLRAFKAPCEISFIKLSSYEGHDSTGTVKTVIGLNTNIKDRCVVVVEDIVDTGLTMKQLKRQLEALDPKCVKVAALFLKPEKLQYDVKVDYHCFDIPNRFIVGYGLDDDGQYRNLPAIYVKD